MKKEYKSQSAKEAQQRGYGDSNYWDYLDQAAQEHYDHFKNIGMENLAEKMFTQSLGEAFCGNDGD
jgi:hypothetical protein